MLDTPDQIRDEINLMRKRLDKIEEVLTGGDAMWKRKGALDQLIEVSAFVEQMKGFDFVEMKGFAAEYKDFKKRGLTLAGFITSVGSVVWLIIANLDKIKHLFGK